ncbi:SDR family NAD(P)-dependent oxidoreductase [Georgenia sp. H159]|uniref:SDR family NAD(P)-dependent oxidoreductase n=1 Tax=Georgenia sp. H159 TaxID=3076115 RepID=UPI002D767836|nr:SDR family NAD(P)-dependent oxidoreductase [Georgenia sp. H159]
MTTSEPDRSPRRVVLIGSGDLGIRVGTALAGAGDDVTGVRRTIAALPEQIRGVGVDLAVDDVPDLPADLLVIALAPDQRDEEGYRRTYLEAMRRGVDAVLRSSTPGRSVLVSSTGVYGDLQGDLDEETVPEPDSTRAEILLEAERRFHDALPSGVVLRLSGLYGPPGGRLVDQVRRGENPDPGRWTNRMHRDDAAAAIVHLLTRPAAPERLYIGTDDEPSPAGAVRDFVADELGLERPAPTGTTEPSGRRMLNARLRGSGFQLRYPTFREGYRALLREEPRRR